MKRFTLVAVTVIASAVAGCGGSSSGKAGGRAAHASTVLTLVETAGPGQFDAFARAVARRSNGEMRIDTRYRWHPERGLRQEPRLIDDVRTGRADLGAVGVAAFEKRGVTSFRALSAPLLVESYARELRLLRSPIAERILSGLDGTGLVGLSLLPGALEHPVGITRPLLQPGDWAGQTIGMRSSPVAQAAVRALGAKPLPVVETRAASGVGATGLTMRLETLDGATREGYVTANVGLWPAATVLFANGKLFSSLTAKEREVLRAAARDTIDGAVAYDRAWRTESVAVLCREAIRFAAASAADVAALRRELEPVRAALARDARTKDLISAIAALPGGGAGDEMPRCPAAGAAAPRTTPATSSTALEGHYRVLVSASDVTAEIARAAAALHSSISARGERGFELDLALDGRNWSISERPDGWALRGSYRVVGDTVALSPEGDQRRALQGPRSPAWRLRWSVYRGALRLTPLRSPSSPYWLGARPWRRIGSASPVPAAPSTQVMLPPDGVYRGGSSIAGLIRAGVDAQDAFYNGGRKVLVLKHGRYSIKWLEQNRGEVDPGSQRVAGNRVAFRFKGDRSDSWLARWSYAQGQLRFTDVVGHDALFAVAFLGGAPWLRVE